LSAYNFLKYLVQENDIHVNLSGLKTFLSFSETDTEKSEFCSIAVLDETADSNATVLKTLNVLHKKISDWDKASVSSCCWRREIL
jgi:hypothetical protein